MEKQIYTTYTLFLFGFSFGKSLNDRDFAMVPLA
jgi:hypothetical protein